MSVDQVRFVHRAPTTGPDRFAAAWRDFRTTIPEWRLWHLLAWQEIKQRYRRSVLGPFWLTISMALQMAVMGALLTTLLNATFDRFLPYICAGLVTWHLLSQIVIDGSVAFVNGGAHIVEIKKPLLVYIAQVIWRNLIVTAHNFIVYVVVAAVFVVVPNQNTLLIVVTLPIAILSVAWAALFLAVLSARFRDVPMIVQSAFTILFWMTPLFYKPEHLGAREGLVELNPLTHIVAMVREPLLGNAPTTANWLVTVAILLVGWVVAFTFFARYRARVYYWL